MPKLFYPDFLKNDTFMSDLYKDRQVDPRDFLANGINTQRFLNALFYRKLGQPLDPHEWTTIPQTVNAFYEALKNQIIVPASMLVPPFFDTALPV